MGVRHVVDPVSSLIGHRVRQHYRLDSSDGRVVLVGLGGVVLRSSDPGKTFEVGVQSDRLGIAAVAEGAPGRVVLLGEKGVDAPESWPEAGRPDLGRQPRAVH